MYAAPNPEQYTVYPNVCILDEHELPATGDQPAVHVTEADLHQIAANNNGRLITGDPTPIVWGHTIEGAPEKDQPPQVGYADRFTVNDFPKGGKAIYCDFHIRKAWLPRLQDRIPESRRSVELWVGRKQIDPISLLGATSPERDLGVLHFARRDTDGPVVRYEFNPARLNEEPTMPLPTMPLPNPAAGVSVTPPAPGGMPPPGSDPAMVPPAAEPLDTPGSGHQTIGDMTMAEFLPKFMEMFGQTKDGQLLKMIGEQLDQMGEGEPGAEGEPGMEGAPPGGEPGAAPEGEPGGEGHDFEYSPEGEAPGGGAEPEKYAMSMPGPTNVADPKVHYQRATAETVVKLQRQTDDLNKARQADLARLVAVEQENAELKRRYQRAERVAHIQNKISENMIELDTEVATRLGTVEFLDLPQDQFSREFDLVVKLSRRKTPQTIDPRQMGGNSPLANYDELKANTMKAAYHAAKNKISLDAAKKELGIA